MTRIQTRRNVVAARLAFIQQMLAGIALLPLASRRDSLAEPHVAAAGESFLFRAFEAIFDLSRFLIARESGRAIPEYGVVPLALLKQGIIDAGTAERMIQTAEYRNRLVYFYNEVSPEEVFNILNEHVTDFTVTFEAIRAWVAAQPDRIDTDL